MKRILKAARAGFFETRRPLVGTLLVIMAALLAVVFCFWLLNAPKEGVLEAVHSSIGMWLIIAVIFSAGADLLCPESPASCDDTQTQWSELYIRELARDREQLNLYLVGMLAEYDMTGNVTHTIEEVREYYRKAQQQEANA